MTPSSQAGLGSGYASVLPVTAVGAGRSDGAVADLALGGPAPNCGQGIRENTPQCLGLD
mgnify:CR=1 FL=1